MEKHRDNSPTQPAKDAAARLRKSLSKKSVEIGRGQSLDILSEVCEHRDWNTFSASISSGSTAKVSPRDVMSSVLALGSKDSRVIIRRLETFVLHDLQFGKANDIWDQRMRSMMRAVIPALIAWCDDVGEVLTINHLKRAFQCESCAPEREWKERVAGPVSLMCLYYAIRQRCPADFDMSDFDEFLKGSPGFSSILVGNEQSTKFVEQVNFTSMRMLNLLADFIEELR